MSNYVLILLVSVILVCAGDIAASEEPTPAEQPQVTLRIGGAADYEGVSLVNKAARQMQENFLKRYPHIRLLPHSGLVIPGMRDIAPLMQIAGDIPQEVMAVDFRRSDTYIQNKFLYPLDKYIEELVGADIPDGHLLDLHDYLVRLSSGPNYEHLLAPRAPPEVWKAMRRECPYEAGCPYVKQWGDTPSKNHYHTWCLPTMRRIRVLRCSRALFAKAKLPNRAPRDCEEMLEWARKLTNPHKNQYGLRLTYGSGSNLGSSLVSFIYTFGGRIVEQDEQGKWHCVFDSEEAVEACYFVARLFLEPFENEYGRFSSVLPVLESSMELGQTGMHFWTFNDGVLFQYLDFNEWYIGPVPARPDGMRATPIGCQMVGIYAGLEDDPVKRKAAWQYIKFASGPEADVVLAEEFVKRGYAKCVRPRLLRAAGYEEYLKEIPPEWNEVMDIAMSTAVAEPYGKNCQMIYNYLTKAVNQILGDPEVVRTIREGDSGAAKDRIRQILTARVAQTNEKMLNDIPPKERRFRLIVASVVAVAILIVFLLVFRRIFKTFSNVEPRVDVRQGSWRFGKFKWAYLIMLPAMASIALWAYYPLVRGSLMAFQDYNIRGLSRWVGLENFANVLFDDEFWFAFWISAKYALLFMVFGFGTPIALAFLLAEVPRGRLLFRTIYYLPTVLAGVVVLFLWKGFYGQFGLINNLINLFIDLINLWPGVAMEYVRVEWLKLPRFALLFCLFPVVWAGMGPGCLIYLAALKTVPEQLYEAADVDGAGIFRKAFYVAIPGIRALIMINFIGAMIGAVRASGGFMMVMTGGGPYNPYGQTEVVGLHIFYEAFMYLRFGVATSMAWIVGSMLVGFTVLQLQRLSRLEFRTAEKVT